MRYVHCQFCNSSSSSSQNTQEKEMNRRLKSWLSLPSFQLCRSKQCHALPPIRRPFSVANPKSLEISFPNFPDPPPTPNRSSNRRPADYRYNPTESFDDSEYSSTWPETPPLMSEMKKKKMTKIKKKKNRERTSSSFSFNSEGASSDRKEATESLLSSSMSFDSSCDFGYSIESMGERPTEGFARNKKKIGRKTEENETAAGKKSVFRRLMPCKDEVGVGYKVNESMAVLKKSRIPYEDFKRSMLEMILEKQIFEPKELEQMLQCFLSLNSRHHHAVIVQVFSEIWQVLFSDSD